jgi:hypothetical protein
MSNWIDWNSATPPNNEPFDLLIEANGVRLRVTDASIVDGQPMFSTRGLAKRAGVKQVTTITLFGWCATPKDADKISKKNKPFMILARLKNT